jgi:RND family efflux transporter MFP subunit
MNQITLTLVWGLLIAGTLAAEKAALPKNVPFQVEELKKTHAGAFDKKAGTPEPFLSRISGQVSATSKSSLSFRVPGFIEKIAAKPGDIVKKGGILATLDAGDFDIQYKLMKLNLDQAKLGEKTAKTEFDREQQLKEGNVSTASQFDMMETKYKQAQVAVALAQINLKNAERNVEQTKLRAPYDCILAVQYKDRAEHVGLDTKVFDIYEVNSTEINLNAPEILIGRLKVGTKLSVSVPAVNYAGEASITKIVSVVSETTRTFKVTAIFTQADLKVVPGLFAEALLK